METKEMAKGAVSKGYKRNKKSGNIYEMFEINDGDFIQLVSLNGKISGVFRRADVILTLEDLNVPTTIGIEFRKYIIANDYEDLSPDSVAYKEIRKSFYGASLQLLSSLKSNAEVMSEDVCARFIAKLMDESIKFWVNGG